MPRNDSKGTSSRSRPNRITNKTRLKILLGDHEVDSIIMDEDEEKARALPTAGVDAEDANEHHLLAVLNAAARKTAGAITRPTRGARTEQPEGAAYIPTPDAGGLVTNYTGLYQANNSLLPATYIRFSDTVEECVADGLSNGFTYYLDERDQEWLD